MKKKLSRFFTKFYSSIVIFFMLFSLIISIVSCSKDSTVIDNRWGKYIHAYTSGQVSRESMIRVVFNNDLVKENHVGKSANDIFSFDPDVDGKAEWAATNEIVFVPEESLVSGQKYRVVLDLENYIDIDSNFHFFVEAIKQDFDFNFKGFMFPDLKNLEIQNFRGTINTADVVDNNKIEKILEASQEGRDLKIRWKHNENRKKHDFIINNVIRGKNPSVLLLKWEGDDIDVDREGEMNFDITAKATSRLLMQCPI